MMFVSEGDNQSPEDVADRIQWMVYRYEEHLGVAPKVLLVSPADADGLEDGASVLGLEVVVVDRPNFRANHYVLAQSPGDFLVNPDAS